MITRRTFLDSLAVGTTGLVLGSTAKSYASILGANDRLNFAIIGLNGRGYAHLSSLKANRTKARLAYVCDVESNILANFAAKAQTSMGEPAIAEKDFRKVLAMRDVDAITIATHPTTGTHRWPCWPSRQANTSTLRSHAATIPLRARF